MATTVGSVEVEVVARIDKLERDLKKVENAAKKAGKETAGGFDKAKRSTDKLKNSAKKAGKAVDKVGKNGTKSMGTLATATSKMGKRLLALGAGIATIAGVRGLVGMARASLDAADSIEQTSKKLGLSTDALQEFRFAAEQTGVPITTLDMGIQRFARRIGEAAIGTGEAKDALKQLKIELKDENGIRSTEALFGDAMKALEGVSDPITKLRLAFKLFDSEGVALINLADRFEELTTKAKEMGVVLDRHTIAAASKAKGELDTVSQVIQTSLAPIMADFASGPLTDAMIGFRDLVKWSNEFWNRNIADANQINSLEILEVRLKSVKETVDRMRGDPISGSDWDTTTYGTRMVAELEALEKQKDLMLQAERDDTGTPEGVSGPLTANRRPIFTGDGSDGGDALAKANAEAAAVSKVYKDIHSTWLKLKDDRIVAENELYNKQLANHEKYAASAKVLDIDVDAAKREIEESHIIRVKAIEDEIFEARKSALDGIRNQLMSSNEDHLGLIEANKKAQLDALDEIAKAQGGVGAMDPMGEGPCNDTD
jgi:hypothetical protein